MSDKEEISRFQRFALCYDFYMLFVVCLLPTFVFLQGSTILKNKSAENVSYPSYVILLIVSFSFFVYGIIWKERIIMLISALMIAGSIFTLVLSISFHPQTHSGAFITLQSPS